MPRLNQKLSLYLAVVLAGLITLPTAQAEDSGAQFENLVPVDDAQVAAAYIDPNADFSVFKRAMILDTFVAFRSGWERDQRRGTRSTRVSSNDMERSVNQTMTYCLFVPPLLTWILLRRTPRLRAGHALTPRTAVQPRCISSYTILSVARSSAGLLIVRPLGIPAT